jgi:hypothetical protein
MFYISVTLTSSSYRNVFIDIATYRTRCDGSLCTDDRSHASRDEDAYKFFNTFRNLNDQWSLTRLEEDDSSAFE